MNRLPRKRRERILGMLVEGVSMRGASRLAGVSINTVSKLLRDAGAAAASYHDEHVRGIVGERSIQCDEIWSFIYAKQKNVAAAKSAPEGAGSAWTWTAMDAKSKLIVSYLLSGGRDADSAIDLMRDLSARLEEQPLLSSDKLPSYIEAVQWIFGREAKHVLSKSKTTYVERQNLTLRMGMRRFMRKTNGFSKRAEYHLAHLSLHFFYYNWMRSHISLSGATPAMAAGLAPSFLSWRDLAY